MVTIISTPMKQDRTNRLTPEIKQYITDLLREIENENEYYNNSIIRNRVNKIYNFVICEC